jgi:hypothetical protein
LVENDLERPSILRASARDRRNRRSQAQRQEAVKRAKDVAHLALGGVERQALDEQRARRRVALEQRAQPQLVCRRAIEQRSRAPDAVRRAAAVAGHSESRRRLRRRWCHRSDRARRSRRRHGHADCVGGGGCCRGHRNQRRLLLRLHHGGGGAKRIERHRLGRSIVLDRGTTDIRIRPVLRIEQLQLAHLRS